MREIFALVSAVLLLAAAPPYILDTIKGKTKPQRVTWLIFSILGLIAFISQLALGASWSLVFSGLDTAIGMVVLGMSLKYGVGGHTTLDMGALVTASVGVAIALVVKQPIISLLGVILADVSGTILTANKAYRDPGSETTISWLLTGTAALFGTLAVSKFSSSLLLYPLYLAVANYAIPLAQLLGRKLPRK